MSQVTVTEVALDGVARRSACSWGHCGLRTNCGAGALGGARWIRRLLPGRGPPGSRRQLLLPGLVTEARQSSGQVSPNQLVGRAA